MKVTHYFISYFVRFVMLEVKRSDGEQRHAHRAEARLQSESLSLEMKLK